jgi:NAD(P)H dehydrogenase (quinone)
MRILVVFAHPLATGYLGTLHDCIVEALRLGGHHVDDCDLYAEGFNPVMSRETYLHYLDTKANRAQAGPYIERLLAAEALILISPVWHDGFPAILKGFFDCVFVPGVAFNMADGQFTPALLNIKRVAAICSFGAKRERTVAMGDPQRRFVKKSLGAQIGAGGRSGFIGLYDMDAASAQTRALYLRRVTRAFSLWRETPAQQTQTRRQP